MLIAYSLQFGGKVMLNPKVFRPPYSQTWFKTVTSIDAVATGIGKVGEPKPKWDVPKLIYLVVTMVVASQANRSFL